MNQQERKNQQPPILDSIEIPNDEILQDAPKIDDKIEIPTDDVASVQPENNNDNSGYYALSLGNGPVGHQGDIQQQMVDPFSMVNNIMNNMLGDFSSFSSSFDDPFFSNSDWDDASQPLLSDDDDDDDNDNTNDQKNPFLSSSFVSSSSYSSFVGPDGKIQHHYSSSEKNGDEPVKQRSYTWTSDDDNNEGKEQVQVLDLGSIFSPNAKSLRYNSQQFNDYNTNFGASLAEQRKVEQEQELENEKMAFQMYNFTLAFTAFLLCISLMVVLMKKRIFRRGEQQINRVTVTRRNNNNGRTSSEVSAVMQKTDCYSEKLPAYSDIVDDSIIVLSDTELPPNYDDTIKVPLK